MRENLPLDKIVLDTNNIVSLFLKGDFNYFSDLKFKYDIEVCTCAIQIIELHDVMIREKPYFLKYLKLPVQHYIDFFKRHSCSYDIDPSYSGIKDSKDNFLVDIAYQTKAFILFQVIRKCWQRSM